MKVLVISKGGLELTRAPLEQRVTTIGRSPSCDVVLRAPGVFPVHFLFEWIGVDDFDPTKGNWTVFDVSKADQGLSEGVLISEKKSQFDTFQLQIVDDKLASRSDIGGVIQKSLDKPQTGIFSSAPKNFDVLEIVSVDADSSAVAEITHISFEEIQKNKYRMPKGLSGTLKMDARGPTQAPVFVPDNKAARIFRMGRLLETATGVLVNRYELLECRVGRYRFFLKLTSKPIIPKVKRKFFQEALLFQTTAVGLLVGFGVIFYGNTQKKTVKDIEPRVAKIQVKEEIKLPPPPLPPAPKTNEIQKLAEKEAPVPKKSQAPVPTKKPEMNLTQKPNPIPQPKPSLLNMLKSANAPSVNRIDDSVIRAAPSAESIAKSETGVSVQAVTADQVSAGTKQPQKSVDLSKLAAGVSADGIKANTGGLDSGIGAPNIGKLSTGIGGQELGTSGSTLGRLDGSGFETSGGLDKETVRRVVRSSAGVYRVCWERSLLTQPNLKVRIVYQWMISPEGKVVSIKTKSIDAASPVPSLEACLQEELNKLIYPAAPNGASTNVVYPFEFTPKVQ